MGVVAPKAEPSKSDYCIYQLRWAICRLVETQVGETSKTLLVVESGFDSEGSAEQAFRDKYTEKRYRSVHHPSRSAILKESDCLKQ